MTNQVIFAERIVKKHVTQCGLFKKTVINETLKSLSFEIFKGECVGLLGPNGAGKSTLIKLLTGLLEPTSGSLSILGTNPSHRSTEFLKSVGAVFGHKCSLWWDLPLIRSFENFGMIYGISSSEFASRLDTLVSALELKSILTRPVRQLSLGERVKSEIVAALLHCPSLVFLDEPTIGLDVCSKDELRRFISQIGRTWGSTVLLTSHDMVDIERCCQRTLLLDKGVLHFDGPLDSFRDWLSNGFSNREILGLEDLLVAYFRREECGL